MPSADFLALNPGYAAADPPGAGRRAALRSAPGPDRSGETIGRLDGGALEVVVPLLPPTVNHMYGLNHDGSRRLTDEATAFRACIAGAVIAWTVPARLALTIRLTFGTKHRQDIDNRVKAALDALALALGFDDSRVDRIVIERAGYAKARPSCEMRLAEMAGEAGELCEVGSGSGSTRSEICTARTNCCGAYEDGAICGGRTYAGHDYCPRHQQRFARTGDPTLARKRGRKTKT